MTASQKADDGAHAGRPWLAGSCPSFRSADQSRKPHTAGFASFANAEKPPAKMEDIDTTQRCVHHSCGGWKGSVAIHNASQKYTIASK